MKAIDKVLSKFDLRNNVCFMVVSFTLAILKIVFFSIDMTSSISTFADKPNYQISNFTVFANDLGSVCEITVTTETVGSSEHFYGQKPGKTMRNMMK